VTEVVSLERRLKAVISQRMRQAKHSSIEYKNIQRTTITHTHKKNYKVGQKSETYMLYTAICLILVLSL